MIPFSSFFFFPAIWSHNLSSVRAQIRVLFTPVTCLSRLITGGAAQRGDLLVISIPFGAAKALCFALAPSAHLSISPPSICFEDIPASTMCVQSHVIWYVCAHMDAHASSHCP